MSRDILFNIRVNADERQLIEQLAQRESLGASAAIRRLIRQAVQNSDKEKPLSSVASTTQRHVEMAIKE